MILTKRSFLFLFFSIAFTLDSVVNYFINIPLFVITLIVFVLGICVPGFFSKRNYLSFILVLLVFSTSFVFNIFRMGFYKESLSDVLFILSFFGAFFLYSDQQKLSGSKDFYIRIFLIACLILFLATYLGFDQNIWGNTMGIKTEDIEYNRSYRQGFFRKAHIASYFFTFFILYFLNKFKNKNVSSFKYVITFIPLATMVLLTGSRTSIVVVFIAIFIYYFKLKFLKYLLPFTGLCLLSVVYIDNLLVFFDNTIFYQYLSIIKTMGSNFERLSRVIIWSSWWSEIKTFTITDFLFGRGFNASLSANLKNTSSAIWFHNDFLSIIYSYGILPLLLYISLFVMIYKKHKNAIKNNVYLFLMFTSFCLSAFFNGFYYYYTIIILYLFYAMINEYKSNHKEENYDAVYLRDIQ